MDSKENMKANPYAQSVIYKIVPKDIDLDYCYVGSTHRFSDRKATHKSDCQNEWSPRYNLEVYEFIRKHGGWHKFVILVIEEYACDCKRALEKREQYWKQQYGSNIGKRAYAEKNQYYLDHKDEILTNLRTYYAIDETRRKRKRDYYLQNRDKILQRNKDYYQNVVKKGCCSKLYDVALTEN